MRTLRTLQPITPRAAHGLTMLAAGLLLVGSALAQAPTGAASTEAGEELKEDKAKEVKLHEVTVTAERRKESAQRTSISLTAVSGEEARDRGQTTLQQVIGDTPALAIQQTPQGGQVYIRGVGSSGDSNWVDPAVGLMLDGVYSGRAEAVLGSLYDVARIEVLRGPQGTLYGRNSTGGTINVIANEPEKTFGAGVNTQLGNYNLKHVDGMVNVPLGESFAARVAAVREKRDGYFSNNGYASDLAGARLKLRATPTKALTLGLTLDHYRQKGNGATTVPRAIDNPPPFATWPTYPSQISDPWQVDDLHPADIQDIKFDTVSGHLDYNFGVASLTVIPAHVESKRRVSSDLVAGTALSPTLGTSLWTEKQNSVEVRLTSPAASSFKWVVGTYYFESENNQVGQLGSPLSYDVYGQRVPLTSKAVFGQTALPVASGLRLIVGARYTEDKKTQHFGIRSKAGSFDSGLQQVAIDDSAVTWKVGTEYDLAPSSMVYASLSTGYKAGGFSTSAVPPRIYEAEHLRALEIGTKNRFFENTLQFNAAAFLYRYKNHQVQFPAFEPSPNPEDPSSTTQFALYVTNAETATNTGAEAEVRWLMTPDGQVKASIAYLDANYGEFAGPSLAYLSGSRMANTARWSGTLGYEHNFDLWGGTLTAGAQMRLSDGYWVTPDKTMGHAWQSGYTQTDLNAIWRSGDDKWSIGAWLRNLENKDVKTYVLPLGRVFIGAPRTFGLNASYRF